jgi:hypothetical protein
MTVGRSRLSSGGLEDLLPTSSNLLRSSDCSAQVALNPGSPRAIRPVMAVGGGELSSGGLKDLLVASSKLLQVSLRYKTLVYILLTSFCIM